MLWTVPTFIVEDKVSQRAMPNNGIQINNHGDRLGDLNLPVNVYNLLDVAVANIKVANLPVPNPGGRVKALSRILISPRARAKGDFSHFPGPPPASGKGKGDPPLPAVPPPTMPWPGYMQMPLNQMNQAAMMPHLPPMMMPHMPQGSIQPSATASSTTPWVPAQSAEQAARERKMQDLMNYLKKRGPDLPQDVSQKVQEFTKKDGAQAKKDLQVAARELGQAKDELEAAIQARVNLVASWKNFLTDAVKTWQEYAQLFQSQEKDHQDRITSAKEIFVMAKTNVDEAKTVMGDVVEINDKDEEEDFQGPSTLATSDKIMESMQFLTTSLEQFRAQAEEIHVEAQSALKRPRIEGPEVQEVQMAATPADPAGAPPSSAAALQPFHKAGHA